MSSASKSSASVFQYVSFLMIAATTLSAMSTTILTPALPFMADFFNVRGHEIGQKILSFNLLGIGFSGIFYGTLSESWGRRPLFLIGLFLFSICALLSFFVSSLNELFLFQILQGCSIGTASVLPLAVIRDIYSGKKAVHFISIMGMMMALSPAFSPLIGGLITQYLGWKFIFLGLSSVGFLFFGILYYFLPETHPKELRSPLSLIKLIQAYGQILPNTRFLRFGVLPWLAFGGLWMYSATAPFFFIKELHLTPAQYGFYPVLTLGGALVGNIFMNRFLGWFDLKTFLKIGSLLILLGVSVLLILSVWGCRVPLYYAGAMFFYCIGFGTLWPAALNLAMDCVIRGKGYGAALIRSGQILSASLSILLSGYMYHEGSLLFPSLFILGCSGIIIALVWGSHTDTLMSLRE